MLKLLAGPVWLLADGCCFMASLVVEAYVFEAFRSSFTRTQTDGHEHTHTYIFLQYVYYAHIFRTFVAGKPHVSLAAYVGELLKWK